MKSSPLSRSARSLPAALLLVALAHPLQAQHRSKSAATPAANTPESLGFSSQRLERLHALELSPGQVQPLFNLALTQAVLKDSTNAARLADQVVQATEPGDPLHGEAQRLLAELAHGH